MNVILFVVGLLWGALSAQFVVQTVTSLCVATIYLSALISSQVPKRMNLAGGLVAFVQAIVYGLLFLGGTWFTGHYIDYTALSPVSGATILTFVCSLCYCLQRVSGVLLLSRLSASDEWFVRAAMGRPRNERVMLARQYQASPRIETLYPSRDNSPHG